MLETKITAQRVPTRSAIRDMMMPPMPEASYASELASAGTERSLPTSLVMSLSATAVIQAAPNDILRTKSATDRQPRRPWSQRKLRGSQHQGRNSVGTLQLRWHPPPVRVDHGSLDRRHLALAELD